MTDTKTEWLAWIDGVEAALERLQDQAAALPEWPLADRWLLRALLNRVTAEMGEIDAGTLAELRARVEQ